MTADFVEQTLRALNESNAVVLSAAPGAGKTTRVPAALLSSPHANGKEIVVLEPRRIAARMAARFVAAGFGEEVGQKVGYQVRFDDAVGPQTRLKFITEGILPRLLLADRHLATVSVVVFDEFHERHVATDLGLALVRRLQQTHRPDLKIVVMSATLDGEKICAYLGGCPFVQADSRHYEVAVEYAAQPSLAPLDKQVSRAVRRLLQEEAAGDVLVFLPGVGEIVRAQGALQDLQQAVVLPLHGSLSAAEQDRAVSPQTLRKVVLATNVAETSITIEGVRAVVDSGLARISGFNVWSGLPSLTLAPISQASAVQRAGRAGRLAPGRVLRLYTQHDFDSRPAHTKPELLRIDLADTILLLAGLAADASQGFDHSIEWIDAPKPGAVQQAKDLLLRLGALTQEGRLSARGRAMLSLPLHPRLAVLVLESAERGWAREGAALAAFLGERLPNPGRSPTGAKDSYDLADPLTYINALGLGVEPKRSARETRELGLHPGLVQSIQRTVQSILKRLPKPLGQRRAPAAHGSGEHQLRTALLLAFADRVAKRRDDGGLVQLADGRTARLHPSAALHAAPFGVALDVEHVQGSGRHSAGHLSHQGRGPAASKSEPQVRLYSAIEPEWLLDVFPERIVEQESVVWNAQLMRAEKSSRLLYDALVLHESRTKDVDPKEAQPLLMQAVEKEGVSRLLKEEFIDSLRARLAVLAQHAPELSMPILSDGVSALLAALCAGCTSMAEVRAQNFAAVLQNILSGEQQRHLERLAPTHVSLPGGRRLTVHYECNREPWVESFLQDFFGLQKGPTIVAGRLPLTVQLLAPNRRPVQVTKDLMSFWSQAYPTLQKSLSRRYPRHPWPDNPAQAAPPKPRARR